MTTIYIDAAPHFAPVLVTVAAVLVASAIGLARLAWRDLRPRAPRRAPAAHRRRSPIWSAA